MSQSNTEYPILTFDKIPMKVGFKHVGRLYYLNGNFFSPDVIPGNQIGVYKRGVREFKKQHAEMIKKDRAHPDYRTLVQLLDEQHLEFGVNKN